MRVLSPRIEPPVRPLDGSTASTATRWPAAVSMVPKASMKVLLPTPGTPVMPTRCAPPACGSSGLEDGLGAGLVLGPGALDQRDGAGEEGAVALEDAGRECCGVGRPHPVTGRAARRTRLPGAAARRGRAARASPGPRRRPAGAPPRPRRSGGRPGGSGPNSSRKPPSSVRISSRPACPWRGNARPAWTLIRLVRKPGSPRSRSIARAFGRGRQGTASGEAGRWSRSGRGMRGQDAVGARAGLAPSSASRRASIRCQASGASATGSILSSSTPPAASKQR